MKHKYLLLILLVPVAVFAAADVGDKINERAVTPSGQVDPKAIKMPGDAKLLGLDSNAKPYLQSRSTKPPSHVKGLNTDFANRLAGFFKAAESSGHRLSIFSGYRSPAHQASLFKKAVAKYGSVAKARKWVAPPGGSNHNRGIAVDLKFSSKKAKNWAHGNAGKYGLKFRMAHEPWHIEPSGGVKQGGEGQGGDIGQGGYQPSVGGGTPPSSGGQEQKPPVGQAPQAPQPPSGGSGGAPPTGQNPYSKAGNGTDPYGIWKDPATGEVAVNVANITCDPGTIGGTERSLIEWSCGGESTRSRGATTRLQSRFNTKGRLTGKGYARPGADTSYKIQCVAGDKVVGEAVCKVRVGGSANTGGSTTANDGTRSVLHLSAARQTVGWGESTTIQWATIGTSNCRVKGGIINDGRSSGSADTGKLYKLTTYILTCDTSEGSKPVKIEVKIR